MKIQAYSFGRMVIDGKIYTKDLVLTRENIYPNWWRKEGHRLHLEDIIEVLEREKPKVLIVGKGYYGYMEVTAEVREYLRSRGIKLIEGLTGDVWKEYNTLISKKVNVVAAFHLTC
ncbi:MAG: hypothetical protein DRJ38_00845 [Thermoprotei archaeon]|nr:MAG: hypothetical protein DRJ38_00845 [Thermoprotei archaeon]